ncbi:MAG TPA: hypothetical protein VJZ26_06545 [Blastocatellia bacterium]|nr:hypothetical protein [Blastocatellia bacterium]
MGRFAKSYENAVKELKPPNAREVRPDKMRRQRAKGIRFFCIVVVSLFGLGAGWMLGRAWLQPPEVALMQPSAIAKAYDEGKQSPEDGAKPDSDAPLVEQGGQFQSSEDKPEYNDRKRVRVRRASRAGDGPIRTMLKPFKAINPMKLRKFRLW